MSAILKEVFNRADKTRKGTVTMDEFMAVLFEMNEDDEIDCNVEGAEMMFMKMVNEDGDKEITLEEILGEMNNMVEQAIFEDPFNVKTIDATYYDLVSNMMKLTDENETGFVSAAELKKIMLKMKPNDQSSIDKTVDMFIQLGSDSTDRKLKIEEAMNLLTGQKEKKDPREKMKTMFRMCDTNADGYISKKEMADFLKLFDDEEAEDDEDFDFGTVYMFMCDDDQDGKLNYTEFCAAITAN